MASIRYAHRIYKKVHNYLLHCLTLSQIKYFLFHVGYDKQMYLNVLQ